jgi:peptidoglycan/xylan/chitin deacetylase (PgdA/CDA1 family)
MTGTLVISLDFELMWGVRDHRTIQDYGDAVLGGRQAIPKMLARFQHAGIRATWATVGLLFAKNRTEMLDYAPTCRPKYQNESLTPYLDIEHGRIGENEDSDPLHFGASLIDQIAETPGQEIATHTYSHYYCMEDGATEETFLADMFSAKSLASQNGYQLKSIVFPRNQTTKEYLRSIKDLGLHAYRGDANGWLYQARPNEQITKLFRLARFLDGALPIGGNQVVAPVQSEGLINVPASRFLRPWRKGLELYNLLHIRRIKAEIEMAARLGGCYHLWWHPHNFGRNIDHNLMQLDEIINCFKACHDNFGMESKNMFELSS